MRIGVDASRAVMARRAGVGRYSREVVAALVSGSDHEFRLYANGAGQPAWARRENVAWCNLRLPRLWTHVRLSSEMARHPPDALFVPAHVVPVVHPAATVVTIHDLGYLSYPECHPPRQRLYLRLSTIWNARAAAMILADSQWTRNDLIERLRVPSEKIAVAYPGVSAEFEPQPAQRIEAVSGRYHLPERYLLYVGTVQPRKNLARLVDAHALVREAPPLVLAGAPGWLSGQLISKIKAAGARVHLLGYVDDSDLPALISGADALVLPSLYEGFGIPVLEAMACGTPVMASCTSSLPEVVGDAGILVDPLSVEAIASGIKQMCADPALARELAQKGRQRARRFTWAACARVALQAIGRAYANTRT